VAKATGFSRFFLVYQTELEPKCLEVVTFFELLAEISLKFQNKTQNLKKTAIQTLFSDKTRKL
jgi:hypothetical protein